MDWMQFVSSMSSSLAWPIASIVIVSIFKDGILKRLPDLSKLTLPGGISAEFNHELELVEAGVTGESIIPINDELIAPEPPPSELHPLSEAPTKDLDKIVESPRNSTVNQKNQSASRGSSISEPELEHLEMRQSIDAPILDRSHDALALHANPTGVVMESWKALESALRDLASHYLNQGSSLNRRIGILQIFALLLAEGAVTQPEIDILKKMLKMRNLAAHSNEKITEADAKRFQEIAEALTHKYNLRST